MTETMGDRADELRAEAQRLNLDDSEFDIHDVKILVGAYGDLLGLDETLVYDLSMTVEQIRYATQVIRS